MGRLWLRKHLMQRRPLRPTAYSTYGNSVLRLLVARAPLQVRPEVDFETLSRSAQVDYSGDEVLKSLPLRLGELMPGLPDDGVAAQTCS